MCVPSQLLQAALAACLDRYTSPHHKMLLHLQRIDNAESNSTQCQTSRVSSVFHALQHEQAAPLTRTCMTAGSGLGKQPLAEPCAPITSGPLGVATPVSPPLPSTGVGASTSRARPTAMRVPAPAAVRVQVPQRERRESVRLFLGDPDNSPRCAELLGLPFAVLCCDFGRSSCASVYIP